MAGDGAAGSASGAGRWDSLASSRGGAFALAAVCCLFWGSTFPGIKASYSLLSISPDDVPSMVLLLGVRFLLAGLAIVAFSSVVGGRPDVPRGRADWRAVLAMAATQGVLQSVLFSVGMATAPGTVGSVIQATETFFAVAFAAWVFRTERMTAGKLLGCVAGFAGVVVLSGGPGAAVSPASGGWGGVAGEAMLLAGTMSGALASCLVAPLARETSPRTMAGWEYVLSGAVLTAYGLAAGGTMEPAGPEAYALFAYMVLDIAVTGLLWLELLAHNPVSRVVIYSFMTPLFGFAMSAAWLGEWRDIDVPRSLLALALVTAGVIVVNLRKGGDAGRDGEGGTPKTSRNLVFWKCKP